MESDGRTLCVACLRTWTPKENSQLEYVQRGSGSSRGELSNNAIESPRFHRLLQRLGFDFPVFAIP